MTQTFRERLEVLKAKRSHVSERLREEKIAAEDAEHRILDVLEAQNILQQVAKTIQQQAHEKIASVVSRCLSAVFEEEAYEFRIHFEQKRGRTEARLVFARDGHELNPVSGSGGGVLDVASFALRLACLLLRKPSGRRLLIMDEPFKMVSAQYVPRVVTMLETLCQEMGFQMVMVTHNPNLAIGEIVDLT